jgi:uncharacterized membrane protein YbjE (DUF340 family)
MSHLASRVAGAFVFAGPVAWLISTQLNYSLAATVCGHEAVVIAVVAMALISISLLGTAVSWWQWRAQSRVLRLEDTETQIPNKFLAGLGILLGLLFGAVIALQASALFFLDGCLR